MPTGSLADLLTPATPTKGNPKAPILIVEFSDFTCGYCGKFYRETLPPLTTQYLNSGKVRFAYRDYPRDEDGWGLVAAHAGRCAGEQGQFWEMHNRLFDQGARLGKGIMLQIAKELRLKIDPFTKCMDSQKHIEAILADRDMAVKLGFHGTPGFLVVKTDGRRFSDPTLIPGALPYGRFSAAIDKLIAKR